jgi:DNA repair protein RecN (Recombination protein N)
VLRDLHVRNLAVLAAGSVELGPGLNVLTGETGAGKSLVVDSLLLLAGARASSDLIRTGADQLTVTGVFAPPPDDAAACRGVLAEAGIEVAAGEEIVVRREVSREGRNRVFVNDQPVTLRLLAELAASLLRIHGQREELALVESDLQRQWLDRCGGAEAARLLAHVGEAFEAWRRLAERVEDLQGDERRRAERLDLLRFQVDELAAAKPQSGELAALRSERDVLRHAEAIGRALGDTHAALHEDEGAALERLARAHARLGEIAAWEPEAAGWQGELAELEVRLAEVARAVGRRLDQVEADPVRLDAVEERLALLERLARKHGGDADALAARLGTLTSELAEIEADSASLDELIARRDAALAAYAAAASELSAARERWGRDLAARLERELADLALARARLEISLAPRRRADSPLRHQGEAIEIGPRGFDQVTFLFAPNPGEELRPLSRIASGGELARLYLALQLAAHDEGASGRPTLIFDEVDAGVGGAEASALGLKLARLARGGQILAVTHLPQVASFADRHVLVRKRVEGARTATEVQPLAGEERIAELARMLAGHEVTALSRQHAAELVASAQSALRAAVAASQPLAPASPAAAAGRDRTRRRGGR